MNLARQLLKTCSLLAVLSVLSTPASLLADEPLVPAKAEGSLRLATFNVSLNREQAGELTNDLQADNAQASAIAAVIRAVQPDILLLNELDYDPANSNAELFQKNFLSHDQVDSFGNAAWPLRHTFSSPVNTGEPSGLDLNANQKTDDPEDAWGFGRFPGQYGMAVFSRFEIDTANLHALQKLKWSSMPGALQPRAPGANADYYSVTTWQQLRLSSKSFWDVPVRTPLGTLHVLASHPTPPAFDGPEDRNGCRNHDEVKLIQHYIEAAEFIVDDRGQVAGLSDSDAFVVLGDLNTDPRDGDSRSAAIVDLLKHPRVAQYPTPQSRGAELAAQSQAGANQTHRGNPAEDTGDFNDRSVGNLRIDYVLPSANFRVIASGVFWPDLDAIPNDLRSSVKAALDATDHHLVWVDVCAK